MNLTLAAIIILSVWVIGIVVAGLILTLRPGGAGVRFGPAATPVPAAGERLEILLGGEAEVLGNPRGGVQGVLVRADNRRLVAVELGASLVEGEAVPADAIVDADGQTVSLADHWDEISVAEMPDAVSLRANAAVVGADGKRLGKLRLICVDKASGMVTALVVAARGTNDDRLVPAERVLEAGPQRIVSDIRVSETAALPVFSTDWDLRQQIQARLSRSPDLGRALRIDVLDQRVGVQGYVADRAQADRVAELVRSVPGILQLDLKLLTDDDLARAVQSAINRDPQTAAAHVQVIARTGVVDITGQVADRSTARRIESISRQVDGVEVIHNMVTVPTTQRASA